MPIIRIPHILSGMAYSGFYNECTHPTSDEEYTPRGYERVPTCEALHSPCVAIIQCSEPEVAAKPRVREGASGSESPQPLEALNSPCGCVED